MADNDYQSLFQKLQKETNEKLKKQDHTISKLEKKIDKMQQQNHAQMQTLDLRMQQMMGMFQMFMMNQTIGMQPQNTFNPNQMNGGQPPNQSHSQPPTPNHNQLHHHQNNNDNNNNNNINNNNHNNNNNMIQMNNNTMPSQLKQSQSALNVGPSPHLSSMNNNKNKNKNNNNNHNTNINGKPLKISTKHISKSQSQGIGGDDAIYLTPTTERERGGGGIGSDSDYDTDNMSDNDDGIHSKSRDHSKSRKKHKHKPSKKERKKDKKAKKEKKKHKHRDKDKDKDKEKDKEKDNKKDKKQQRGVHDNGNSESIPIFDEKDMDITVPPPPDYQNYAPDPKNRSRGATIGLTLTSTGSGRPIPPPPPKNQDIYILDNNNNNNRPIILRNTITDGASSPKPAPPPRDARDGRDGSRSKNKDKYKHRDKDRKHRHRDHSKSRKHNKNKSHEKSQSEDVNHLVEKKRIKIEHKQKKKRIKKSADSVDVVDFVQIDTKFGKNSPTMSDSRTLLDHLKELDLDVETPSDEESLIYVQEDDLKEDDPDIEVSYDWNARKPKKNKKHKQRNIEQDDDDESNDDDDDDDDISILSLSKQPGIGGKGGIDDEDLGDSDYSGDDEEDDDDGESLHSSEDQEEYDIDTEDQGSSSPNEEDEEQMSKAEKKRRKKERKKKKKRDKKRRKKEKRRKEKREKKKSKKDKKNSSSAGEMMGGDGGNKKDKKNSTSLDVSGTSRSNSKPKLEEEGINGKQGIQTNDGDFGKGIDVGSKKRTTITGKIKKIGQKLKIGLVGSEDGGNKDTKDDNDKLEEDKVMKIDDITNPAFKIRPNPLSKNSTLTFKGMFKGKGKQHKRDDSHISLDYSKVIGKEEELIHGRTERAATTITHNEVEKKKKKFGGLRGFKERRFKRKQGKHDTLDDDLVDYGLRKKSKKKKSKPRRGSDSNISAMSNYRDPWFDNNAKKDKKKKKKKRPDISIDAVDNLLQPDLDGDVTPPPSPLDKGLRFDQMYGGIPEEVDSDEHDDLTDDEIDDEQQHRTKDDPLEGGRIKKNSSIDDYTKSRGSKSTSKDIMISDDLDDKDDKAQLSDDFDPDIDVGDYDWTSYAAKNHTKLATTHSDEDIATSTESASKLIISPKIQEIRPQSARVPSNKSPFGANAGSKGVPYRKGTGNKDEDRMFFPADGTTSKLTRKSTDDTSSKKGGKKGDKKGDKKGGEKGKDNKNKVENVDKEKEKIKKDKPKRKGTKDDKDGDIKKNPNKHKRTGSKGVTSTSKKKKGCDKKKEKPKGIKVITEDKKSSIDDKKLDIKKPGKKGKKSGPGTPTTPSSPAFGVNKKKRKGTGGDDNNKKKGLNKKRNSEQIKSTTDKLKKRNITKKHKDTMKSTNKKTPKSPIKLEPSTPTSPHSLYVSGEDDSKEPEVLERARGQSMKQTLSPSNCNDNKGIEVEYIFANKKLKGNVPKMEYSKYESNTSKPEFVLNLEHVIGYMGYDNLCRNNLYSLKNEKNNILIYNVGCLAVIHDLDRNEQILYRDHKCPITSITVHPKINYIATSSLSSPLSRNTATIRVWNPNTLDSLPEIKCTEIIGEVRHLNFSPISTLLFLTCGENQKNTKLMAFKLEDRGKPVINVQFKTINSKTVQIYGMIFNHAPDLDIYIDQFIVYGSNILYWCQTRYFDGKRVALTKVNGDNISFKYCKINKLQPKGSTDGKKEKAYHCGLFLDPSHDNNIGYYILGGQSGTIYLGYKNTIICSIHGHNGRVQSLSQFTENKFVSVGYDGMWKIWNIDYDNGLIEEITTKIEEEEEKEYKNNNNNIHNNNDYEYEHKRSITDHSDKIIKSGSIKVLCEDCFVPSNDNISKHAHSSYYDRLKELLYIGTSCNSIISISGINVKNGDNDLQIISSGHSAGIVGVAISPKLDSLIATLSECGLLRLWNISPQYSCKQSKHSPHSHGKNNNIAKRLDNCVALQSLISCKQQNKLKATCIAWSPDGKYIAMGYNISKVSLCTAHPLKKVQEIDLSQYKNKGKQIKSSSSITALCFSYDKNVLAVAHSTYLSLFNVEKTNKKCTKWNLTLTLKEIIKHLYFSEDDDYLCLITENYDTKFYNISMTKRSILQSMRSPKADIVWWPRIPLTSYILKGLYQKESMKWKSNELIDADICQSLKCVASADKFGIIRLHKLPALNEKSHNLYKHHYGQISKILFIPDQERLISVGYNDRTIIKWNIQEIKTML